MTRATHPRTVACVDVAALEDPMARARLGARLWQRVEVPRRDADRCWAYRGARNSSGTGHLRCGPTTVSVGRLVWLLVHGAIPDGAQVVHRCGRPDCARPDHLVLVEAVS